MGDGIGGAVIGILANNAFELLVSHTRKDNQGDYGKTEKIIIGKIDDPNEHSIRRLQRKTWSGR